MKFTDGNWMMQPGVKAHYPAEAYEIESNEYGLTVIAPTRPIRHRGDTLEGPLLTIRYSSPMPNVIRVRVVHDEGAPEPGPRFPLFEEDVPVSIRTGGGGDDGTPSDHITLTSGRLSVRIATAKGWDVRFTGPDGEPVTASAPRGTGWIKVAGAPGSDLTPGTYMQEQLSLGVGENVYGLGERFTAFIKNGQTVETWNRDGGTGSDQAYKCVPFYLTNRGYGVFVNHPGNITFEVATERVGRVGFAIPGESLEYFVIYGPTPREVLEKYTALSGRPALPPAWSFGLWLTTSFTTRYDEKSVGEVLDGMATRDLPLHVFHFDCFWMREFRWCDFTWDPRVFPDPVGMLQRLHDRGLKVCVWINPYIAQRSPLFTEGRDNGYLLKRTDGRVWQWDMWQPGMGIVDFTNPEARAWYAEKLRALLKDGVDCFKTDFGERIPTEDVAWHDGSDPIRMHNYYAQLYNETVFRLLEEERGPGEAALFARSATAGGQQFPVHWGGDSSSTFESMAESLRGGLSLGLSGFGFWSHDIGGFEGMPPAAIYKRWIAFGLMSSHSRLHGSSSYRVPWLFDDEAVDVLGAFTRLKCRLMPYLWRKAVAAHRTGLPIMRAMLLEFPDDLTAETLDRQYMLGDSLLVAPVFHADNRVDYYVPEGRWTDFFTGRVIVGPRWVRGEAHGFLTLPLLVRPDTLLPIGSVDSRPDYDWSDGVTLNLYELTDGATATATIPDASGADDRTFTATREGETLRITAAGGSHRPWQLRLIGIESVASVEGGTKKDKEGGILISPSEGIEAVKVRLEL